MNKKQITKKAIIEKTLEMIENSNGIKDVNLRGIAKEMGCAHTNIYNYFGGLEELLWEALAEIIRRMIIYVESDIDGKSFKDIEVLMSRIIEFFLEHPGWYRLVWLEDLKSEAPREVKEMLARPNIAFFTELKTSGFNEEAAKKAGYMITTYIHGELSRWINNRGDMDVAVDTRKKMISNVIYLYRMLKNEE